MGYIHEVGNKHKPLNAFCIYFICMLCDYIPKLQPYLKTGYQFFFQWTDAGSFWIVTVTVTVIRANHFCNGGYGAGGKYARDQFHQQTRIVIVTNIDIDIDVVAFHPMPMPTMIAIALLLLHQKCTIMFQYSQGLYENPSVEDEAFLPDTDFQII